VTSAALASSATAGQIDAAGSVLVFDGDAPVALMAGSSAPAAGSGRHAAIYGIDATGDWLDTVMLDDDGAIESRVFGLDALGNLVVATGLTVDADGLPRAALWRSSDRGATFDAAVFLSEDATSAVDAAYVDGRHLIVVRQPRPDQVGSYELATALDGPDGYVESSLPSAGTNPLVSGIVVFGTTVLITGTSERGEQSVGTAWLSIDGGSTFAEVDDAVLAARTRIGTPILGGDGFVASAASPGTEPTVLVTSADGTTWRAIELSVADARGQRLSLSGAGAFGIALTDNGYAIGISEQLTSIALVDASGQGNARIVGTVRGDLFTATSPFGFAGGLYTISSTRSTFRIAQFAGDAGWNVLTSPPGADSGPIATGARIHATNSGPRILSTSYPHVTGDLSTSYQYSPRQRWNGATDGEWADVGNEFPNGTSIVSGNTTVEIALNTGATDPGDDAIAGPNRGTSVAYRATGDTAWTRADLLVSGPGSDYISDVAPTADGFIAVGDRSVRSESGVNSWSPVITVYTGQAWTEQQLDLGLGDRVWLEDVVASDSGAVLVSGGAEIDGVDQRLLLTRTADGAWVRSDIETTAVDVQIYDIAAGSDGITVITLEDDDWFRHTTLDGATFTKQPLTFENPLDSFPLYAAEIDGRSFVVGSTWTLGVSALTIWEVAEDGSTDQIDLETTPTGLDLSVTDVLVDGSDLLVAGNVTDENRVWTIQLPE